jgi:hypothetical protein
MLLIMPIGIQSRTVSSAETALFAVSAATLCCGSNFFL